MFCINTSKYKNCVVHADDGAKPLKTTMRILVGILSEFISAYAKVCVKVVCMM